MIILPMYRALQIICLSKKLKCQPELRLTLRCLVPAACFACFSLTLGVTTHFSSYLLVIAVPVSVIRQKYKLNRFCSGIGGSVY